MKKIRSIVYNYERSPDDEMMMRYHFLVIDDKGREEKVKRILSNFGSGCISHPFNEVRAPEKGKVVDTQFRYLLQSFDTLYPPSDLNFGTLCNVIRDRELYERKRGTIEDYVADQLE